MGISKSLKVFAFGTENDPLAWQVADLLKKKFPDNDLIKSIIKSSNPDDITGPKNLHNLNNTIIMDAASGISRPTILTIDDLAERGAVTTHDIDLGMTLKLLEKTGKIDPEKIRIIGLPKDSRPSRGLLEKAGQILRELHVEKMSGA
jgi:Ni,Fe-hydrogenase maturation factor